MKLYKIFFTSNEDFSMFGEIPEIENTFNKAGLSVKFNGGGWEGGDNQHLYHDWLSEEDQNQVMHFFKSYYGNNLADICIHEAGNEGKSSLTDVSNST